MGTLNPWKDEGDEGDEDVTPRIGRPLRAWFRRRLGTILSEQKARWGDVTVEEVIAQCYMDEDWNGGPANYLHWRDDEAYRGKNYANGWWAIDTDGVLEDLPDAIHYARRAKARALDAGRFPTLDAWLAAEARGALADKWGAPGAEPMTEPAPPAAPKPATRDDDDARRCRKCRTLYPKYTRRGYVCLKCLAAEARETCRAMRVDQLPTSRGVYIVGGGRHRRLVAIASNGERIIERAAVGTKVEYRVAVRDIWEELDRLDAPANE